jgi:hypothetical protein
MEKLHQEINNGSHSNTAPARTGSRIELYRILRRRFKQSIAFGPEAGDMFPVPERTTDIGIDIVRLLQVTDKACDAKFDPATSADNIFSDTYTERKDSEAETLLAEPKYSAAFSISCEYICKQHEPATSWRSMSVCLDVGEECRRQLQTLKKAQGLAGTVLGTFIPTSNSIRNSNISTLCNVALRDLQLSRCVECSTDAKVHDIVFPSVLIIKFRQFMGDEFKSGSQLLPASLTAWDNLCIDSSSGRKLYRLQSLVFHAHPTAHYVGEHLWPAEGRFVWVHSDSMGSARAGVCQIGDGSSPSWQRQFPPAGLAGYNVDRRACVLLAVYLLDS